MKRPVFVVGAPRSGTTLLHHMLLSAGGFALYDVETHAFNLLEYGFGDLRRQSNRKRMLEAWRQSRHLCPRSLDTKSIETRVMAECRGGGDFLRILMDEVANRQNVDRWAEHTPDHLLYIPEIKAYFPDALIIHVIRDGRDVALSLAKQGWIQAAAQMSNDPLIAAAMYWHWAVRRGRRYGERIPSDYIEVRYEALVQAPEAVLERLSGFLEHDLSYAKIREVAIGTLRKPFSSFNDHPSSSSGTWTGRWRDMLDSESIGRLERLLGELLRDLGYPVRSSGATLHGTRASLPWYLWYFDSKLWIKKHLPVLSALRGGALSDHRFRTE